MLFVELARTSEIVAATSKRSDKIAAFADVFARLAPGEVGATVAFATGATLQGRIGVGWATLREVRPDPAGEPMLAVLDVDRAIDELSSISGVGSQARRREVLHDLLAAATAPEQRLIVGIVGGELRQGALDGVVAAAVAKAAGVTVGEVQRGAMFAGSLPTAAQVALTVGAPGLAAIELTPAQPVQPMLASPASDVADALAVTGLASVEWKLDGARIQAHRAAGEVRLYTRNLNDVTDRLGGVVETVRSFPGGDLVLDGEVLGLDADGAPRRFQDTMGDFGADGAPTGSVGRGSGLRAFFFDVLHADGSLVDEPLSVRRDVLASTVPELSRLPSIVTADAVEAAAFLDRAIEAGHEGVMVKNLDSLYDAGRRGGSWRKVKPVYPFDLVVLAVEWGHGRRQGWLSNLHLGARGDDNGFVMVGKTFKGLTDELLRWQTERFLDLEIGREDHIVHVRPEQVVEIAVDGVQVSTRYPGGVALRFARVRQYRHDKPAAQADTIDQVRSLLR
ncbi:MAG: ATP-dependent DNA ligase [Acidimicrobiaceae bacterium]|nr:ATP-dependent DNA ligase [Acidimicrobiaceae bacterium]